MKKKRNPLSYLGWLGLVGLVGLWAGSPSLMVFLLFFFFFAYGGMTPDELFWTNVRRAGLRALTVNLVLTCVETGVMNGRGIYFGLTVPETLITLPISPSESGLVTLPWIQYEQLLFGLGFPVLIFIITVCTFIFTLMYFNRKEKKFNEEEAA